MSITRRIVCALLALAMLGGLPLAAQGAASEAPCMTTEAPAEGCCDQGGAVDRGCSLGCVATGAGIALAITAPERLQASEAVTPFAARAPTSHLAPPEAAPPKSS